MKISKNTLNKLEFINDELIFPKLKDSFFDLKATPDDSGEHYTVKPKDLDIVLTDVRELVTYISVVNNIQKTL